MIGEAIWLGEVALFFLVLALIIIGGMGLLWVAGYGCAGLWRRWRRR